MSAWSCPTDYSVAHRVTRSLPKARINRAPAIGRHPVVSGYSLCCAYKELTFSPTGGPVSKSGPEGPLLFD